MKIQGTNGGRVINHNETLVRGFIAANHNETVVRSFISGNHNETLVRR